MSIMKKIVFLLFTSLKHEFDFRRLLFSETFACMSVVSTKKREKKKFRRYGKSQSSRKLFYMLPFSENKNAHDLQV